jgi:hypothetical protein
MNNVKVILTLGLQRLYAEHHTPHNPEGSTLMWDIMVTKCSYVSSWMNINMTLTKINPP